MKETPPPLTLISYFEGNEFIFSRCAAAGDLCASSATWYGVVNGFLINHIYWLHHDVYLKLPFDLRGGARICINRGGIPPLEHISSSYLLHLILKYFQMANSRVFFSDLKSGKCSLKLCCRVNLYFSLLFIIWWQCKCFYSSFLFQSLSRFSKALFSVYVSLQVQLWWP